MIEVQTKFNSEITSPLIRLQIRHMWWLFALFPLFFCLIGAMIIAFPETDSDVGFGIGIIVFGLLFLPLVYALSKWFQKIANKTMRIMSEETTNCFRFDQDKFYQEMMRGNDFKSASEYSYNMLYKAFETRTHFFMYISHMQTHIIPKKDIVQGTSQDLASLFAQKLGKKFKVLKIK